MEQTILSLLELNSLVKRSLNACMPDEYWVQAETSDVRSNYSGHCYLEFVQKDPNSNSLMAKARGMIWSSTFARLKPYFECETGQAFVSGIKVLVRVTVTFHELYGYALNVVDIDPTYTVGDMVRRRKEILKRLDADGVLTMNKELEMPVLTQRIAVISSATAAGYGDFNNQLVNNAFGFRFVTKLFPAVMQGDRVESSIINALERINDELDQWDVVVIIRGGGASSDLSGFDTYDLAYNCVQFPLPIITGIGHERDDTVLDMILHTRVKTPTAAAEFLIGHMRETAEELEAMVEVMNKKIPERLKREKELLDRWTLRIPARVQMRLQKEEYACDMAYKRIGTAWQRRKMKEEYRMDVSRRIYSAVQIKLQRALHRLELMEEKVKSASPERLLKKGYSVTLVNGKTVTDAGQLKAGDRIETRLLKGKVNSIVIDK